MISIMSKYVEWTIKYTLIIIFNLKHFEERKKETQTLLGGGKINLQDN